MKVSVDNSIGIDVDKSGRIWISSGDSIYSKNPYYIILSLNRYVKTNKIERVYIEDYREWSSLFKKQNPKLIKILVNIKNNKRLTLSKITIRVPPYNTSITCYKCRHIDKKSRFAKTFFKCTKCGYKTHADINAARNIKVLGLEKYK